VGPQLQKDRSPCNWGKGTLTEATRKKEGKKKFGGRSRVGGGLRAEVRSGTAGDGNHGGPLGEEEKQKKKKKKKNVGIKKGGVARSRRRGATVWKTHGV